MNRRLWLLLMITLLLAAALRVPGMFWGYHLFGNINVGLNGDEGIAAYQADEFLTLHPDKYHIPYVKGFSAQVALAALPLKIVIGSVPIPLLVAIGRGLALIAASITVILVFFLAQELFQNRKAAFFSALFIALSGLHIVGSNIAKQDASTVLFLYVTFFAAALFLKKKDMMYLVIAAVAAGAAVAAKFAVFAALPVVYLAFFESERRWFMTILAGLIIVSSFVISNGFAYGLGNFQDTLQFVQQEIVQTRDYNKLLNPIVYMIDMVPAVGLPVFLLAVYGMVLMWNARLFRDRRILVIVVTLAAYFVQIMIGDVTRARFLLPIIPFIAMCAGYGVAHLRLRKAYPLLLVIIFGYQAVYAASFGYNYFYDTRGILGEWMLEHINTDEKIATGFTVHPGYKYIAENERQVETVTDIKRDNMVINNYGIVIPPEYPIGALAESRYLVIHEALLNKYTASHDNPFKDPVCCSEIYHCDYSDCGFVKALVTENTPFRLLKHVRIQAWTPELIIYRKIFNNYILGDVFLYERNAD